MDNQQFNELIASIRDMGRHMRGEHVEGVKTREFVKIDVKAIRECTGLSPIHFAHIIGVTARTLNNWEKQRTSPTGTARALFKIIEANPDNITVLSHVNQ